MDFVVVIGWVELGWERGKCNIFYARFGFDFLVFGFEFGWVGSSVYEVYNNHVILLG